MSFCSDFLSLVENQTGNLHNEIKKESFFNGFIVIGNYNIFHLSSCLEL